MKTPTETAGVATIAQIQELKIADIVPDPNNRKEHDKEKLQLFADEIRIDGLLQPIVVRPIDDGKFQLIAGERRWRAFQLLKLPTISATVREGEVPKTATRKRVAENFHREDLTPIEKARDLTQLFKDGMSQVEVANFVGAKDQSTISNLMRLLKLPKKSQDWLQDSSLSAAHGKALLRFEGRDKLIDAIAERAIDEGVSTKMLEKGLPFAEALAEDGYVHGFGWLAHTLKDLPKGCQGDADFIMGADEYGDEGVYCLDPEKGRRVEAQLKKETEERRQQQGSSGSSRGNGGGMTPAQKAERKRLLEKNKEARANIDATFARGWESLKQCTDIEDLPHALRVVCSAALDSFRYSRCVKDAAGALNLKCDKDLAGLSPTDALRVTAMSVLMRQCEDAKRNASDVPAAAKALAGTRVVAKPNTAQVKPRPATKAKPTAAPKAKKKGGRAVITDETRAYVKQFTMAGRTGAEMAKLLGISLPSVQTIKKQLGLVRRAA